VENEEIRAKGKKNLRFKTHNLGQLLEFFLKDLKQTI